ncbi:hypothetical protein N9S64_00225 [Candidatus Pelagibacter sp.]|nr:hypothetical protein [Candidatus Pelagibacter sp.]MDA9631090.1 hypothetical protein [Candidatus Pelagibacter sp.]
MIPQKVKDHLEEYINQEVYVQISVIKGKEKVSTKSAINKYLNSNHFRDLSEGRPFNHFIDGLRDKCLEKLKNSPMLNKKTDDKIILELQKKLNNLSENELDNTFWEIETGEFLSGDQIKELEDNRESLISKLDKKTDIVFETIITFCKNYEELCKKKYPEALLPLEISKLVS